MRCLKNTETQNIDTPKLGSAASRVTVPEFTADELSAMIYHNFPLKVAVLVVFTRLAYGFPSYAYAVRLIPAIIPSASARLSSQLNALVLVLCFIGVSFRAACPGGEDIRFVGVENAAMASLFLFGGGFASGRGRFCISRPPLLGKRVACAGPVAFPRLSSASF